MLTDTNTKKVLSTFVEITEEVFIVFVKYVTQNPIVERFIMKISQEQLNNWFSYHAPDAAQQNVYLELRAAAKDFAELIVANCPECADTTVAVRKIREAVMVANQAIACGGK